MPRGEDDEDNQDNQNDARNKAKITEKCHACFENKRGIITAAKLQLEYKK